MQAHHHAHGSGIAAPESVHADPDDLAPMGAAGAAPGGLSPAPNDEAPGVMAEGFRDQETANNSDFAATQVAEQDKAFSSARANLAISGWTLHIVDGGGSAAYWVSRWGQSRTLPDRHALAQFMKQVGCKP